MKNNFRKSSLDELYGNENSVSPQPVSEINWTQVAIQFASTAIPLIIFYFMVKGVFERHVDRIIEAVPTPVDKEPGQLVLTPQLETPAEIHTNTRVATPDKNQNQLL